MAYRLRRSADFADVVRRGRRSAAAGIVVYAQSARFTPDSQDPPQVGFIVGKSVGSAVARNTVRRRLRHLMAQRYDRLPPGAKLVVRATPAAADCPTAGLAGALDSALGPALRAPRRVTARPIGSAQ